MKDLVVNRAGRVRALAQSEAFTKTQSKIDSRSAQVVWYLEGAELTKLLLKIAANGKVAEVQENEVLIQELGVNGLRAVGGSVTFGATGFDSLGKTFFHAARAPTRVAASCSSSRRSVSSQRRGFLVCCLVPVAELGPGKSVRNIK